MKKIIFGLSLLFFACTVQAQTSRGTILLGGDASYFTSKTTYTFGNGNQAPGDIKATTYTFSPAIGFFMTDNLAFGLEIGTTGTKGDNTFNNNQNDVKSNMFLVGPFLRYYKMLGSQAGLFLQGEAIFGSGTQTYTNFNGGRPTEIEESVSSLDAGLRPGLVYFITPRIGLESSFGFLGYQRLKKENDENQLGIDNTTSSFGFALNSSTINMGVRFYLGNK